MKKKLKMTKMLGKSISNKGVKKEKLNYILFSVYKNGCIRAYEDKPWITESYGTGRVVSYARKKIECKETTTGFFVLLKQHH